MSLFASLLFEKLFSRSWLLPWFVLINSGILLYQVVCLYTIFFINFLVLNSTRDSQSFPKPDLPYSLLFTERVLFLQTKISIKQKFVRPKKCPTLLRGSFGIMSWFTFRDFNSPFYCLLDIIRNKILRFRNKIYAFAF